MIDLLGKHAQAARNFCQIRTGHGGGRLVANTNLEAGWAPIDKLDGALGLDTRDSCRDVLGNDITAEEQAAGHWIVLEGGNDELYENSLYLPSRGSHLTIWLPVSKHEKVISATLFCSCLAFSAERMGARVASGKWIRGKLRRVSCDTFSRKKDIRNKVGLELVQIHIQATVKAERGGDARDDLGNQTIKVGKPRRGNPQAVLANVIDCFIVNLSKMSNHNQIQIDHVYQKGAIRMFEGRVCRKHCVVWLNNRARHLGGRVNGKLELGLFPIVLAESLEQQRTETGTAATTKRVENEKALHARAVVRQPPEAVHGLINHFFSDSVVPTRVLEKSQIGQVDQRSHSQLLAASSLPEIKVSGWKRLLYMPFLTSSMTLGSKSM